MKTMITTGMGLIALLLTFVGCSDNMGETDKRVAPVGQLVEPADGKEVVLEPSASSNVYFEWDYVDVEEAGTLTYQVVFDTQAGDFSQPIYKLQADNNGLKNNLTLTHKQLNQIASKAGIKPAEKGTLKWSVMATKGLQTLLATTENRLTITRLAGFEEIPVDVFITGEATEGGTDLAKAQRMKAISNGEFEIYTQLKAGQTFYFVDAKTGTPKQYSTQAGVVKESGNSTVQQEGIYRITLDFNTGASTYTLVTRLGFYFSPEGAILFDLPYVGGGVFQTRATVTFKQESWGRDERYKFRMFIKENGGADAEKEVEWGTLNQTDSRPTASSPESYYYLLWLTDLSQWDNKWKLMEDFDGVEATYTVYLTADQPYTHSITK